MSRSKRRVFDPLYRGYKLATAHILYRMPDYPALLQSFTWQHYDQAPDYPELMRFLTFWRDNLDGELYSVEVFHAELMESRNVTFADGMFKLH